MYISSIVKYNRLKQRWTWRREGLSYGSLLGIYIFHLFEIDGASFVNVYVCCVVIRPTRTPFAENVPVHLHTSV